jgi:thioredoxin reductase
VSRLDLAKLDRADPDSVLDCELCAVEAPDAPAFELAHHAGCRVQFHSSHGFAVAVDEEQRTSQQRIFAAGHCALAPSLAEARAAGRRAGENCLAALKGDGRGA